MGKDFDYASEDGMLFSEVAKPEPEICLGKTFNSAEERREYYRNELRKYLKDPDFRAIDGFPIGEDEDIIALSDPPYYCACPNPWIPDFIKEWESQKIPTNIPYKREPFASDVSEGKTDYIYKMHPYHTKVPYKAIEKYIFHYTNPGDIIFDGFCGSGMTGVAAQACGQLDSELADSVKHYELGNRKCILVDLSPAATFIAKNFNSSIDNNTQKQITDVMAELKRQCSWMFQTRHQNFSEAKYGEINNVVWSDVFICPNCGEEFVFWDASVDVDNKIILEVFECPNCKSLISKKKCERAKTTFFDSCINKTITQAKQKPVQIAYTYNGKRYTKEPDEYDLELLEKIDRMDYSCWYPKDLMMGKGSEWGDTWRAGSHFGITNVHHFYTKRNLITLATFCSLIKKDDPLMFAATRVASSITRGYRFRWTGGGPLSGTLYIPSLMKELNMINAIEEALNNQLGRNRFKLQNGVCISTQSSCLLKSTPRNCIDYIFLDPPFGSNINYSELSFLWEAWLKVKTNNKEEAIENNSQGKGLFEYRGLMKSCFAEAFRILKPGHWMTVEFSNTDSAVWNAIQTSLSEVGFIVANVSALDKQQGSFKAVTTSTAVKQDLIISLYKPDESFEKQITTSVGTEAVWNFVRKHLEYLPLVKKQGESTITVPERDPRIIYDRMISFFVGHNMLIPISSPDFLAQMPTRFAERNGLYYLPDQVQEYDKMVFKQQIKESSDSNALFVYDENSAIAWIRAQLKEKPMTLGELTPLFMRELSSSWTKGERKPELRELLEQNFLCYEGKDDVPPFIHGWLSRMYKNLRNKTKDDPELREKAKGRWYIPDPNKASDLEKIREKSLLKEFSTYESSKGKINEFRIEAVRAGFKKAWQDKNYALIKSICERMPSSVVEEDEKLLMWYSGALTRLGE